MPITRTLLGQQPPDELEATGRVARPAEAQGGCPRAARSFSNPLLAWLPSHPKPGVTGSRTSGSFKGPPGTVARISHGPDADPAPEPVLRASRRGPGWQDRLGRAPGPPAPGPRTRPSERGPALGPAQGRPGPAADSSENKAAATNRSQPGGEGGALEGLAPPQSFRVFSFP